jgi:hypothetical protein
MIEYSEHWLTLSEVGGGNLIEVNRVCRLCIDNKQGRASSDKYCSTSAPLPFAIYHQAAGTSVIMFVEIFSLPHPPVCSYCQRVVVGTIKVSA